MLYPVICCSCFVTVSAEYWTWKAPVNDLTSLVFRDISTHIGLSWEGSFPLVTFFASAETSGSSFIARLNWRQKQISLRKLLLNYSNPESFLILTIKQHWFKYQQISNKLSCQNKPLWAKLCITIQYNTYISLKGKLDNCCELCREHYGKLIHTVPLLSFSWKAWKVSF